jgi:hypothetical protein
MHVLQRRVPLPLSYNPMLFEAHAPSCFHELLGPTLKTILYGKVSGSNCN